MASIYNNVDVGFCRSVSGKSACRKKSYQACAVYIGNCNNDAVDVIGSIHKFQIDAGEKPIISIVYFEMKDNHK